MIVINGVGIEARLRNIGIWIKDHLQNNKDFVFEARYNTYTSKVNAVFGMTDLENYFVVKALDLGFPPSGIKGAVREHLQRICATQGLEEQEKFVTAFTAEPTPEQKMEGTKLLNKLVYYMTGRRDVHDATVLKQFVWTVKRNMLGMSVKHRLMPIFYGPQDTGKTTLANRFCKPLSGLVATDKFSIFSDSTKLQALSRLYVIILDELQNAKETAIEHLKSIISDGEHLQREFHSQKTFNFIKIKTTFIGLSNKPVSECIKDEEMRRFWQIPVAEYAWINQFWDNEIENLDWSSVWNCVGVADKEPIDEIWLEIKATQTMLSTKDHVGEFASKYLNASGNSEHTIQEAYNIYFLWAHRHGNKRPLTSKDFVLQFKKKVRYVKTDRGWRFLFDQLETEEHDEHESQYDVDFGADFYAVDGSTSDEGESLDIVYGECDTEITD